MGFKCCVPTCRQGYADTPKNPCISFHRFPNEQYDPSLREKWLEIISALFKSKTYNPTVNSRVCSLHFQPSDFIATSVDTRRGTGRILLNTPLKLR